MALKTVNSQFYLNQDIVNIREVNAEAMKMIESIISMKKHRYGSILPEKSPESFLAAPVTQKLVKPILFE